MNKSKYLRINSNASIHKGRGSIANYVSNLITKSKTAIISFRIVTINSRSFIQTPFLRLFGFTPKVAALGVATSSKILPYYTSLYYLINNSKIKSNSKFYAKDTYDKQIQNIKPSNATSSRNSGL